VNSIIATVARLCKRHGQFVRVSRFSCPRFSCPGVRVVEFFDDPPVEPRQLDPIFALKRDRCLRDKAMPSDRSAEADICRARDAAWVWPVEKLHLTMIDLDEDEVRSLKKGKGETPFVDIACKLAVLGEVLPIGGSGKADQPNIPPTPELIERRMVEAFRRSLRPADHVTPVSLENGTRQTPQRDSYAFADDHPKAVIGPTTGGGQWPVYTEVDQDELAVILEGIKESPELIWIAGVLADRLWWRSLKICNFEELDEQVSAWIVQREQDPAIEAARRIVLRCLREGAKPSDKARQVYYPALVKRLEAEGVQLIPLTVNLRPRNYGSDAIVGLDEIAAKAGVKKTSTLLRGFVRGKTPLAYRGGRFVGVRSIIRTRPERARSQAVSV
jgi:hypothetical protein